MAVKSVLNPTLIDLAKSLDPNGSIAAVAEILNQTNEITRDGVFKEANNVTSHRITQRTGLPAVYWRMLNRGVPPSHSTKAQVDEAIGFLTARAEVDVKEATLSGNVDLFRSQENAAHIEAMGQEWASTTFYGNPQLNPDRFAGLAPRYHALSGFAASQNVIDGGGGAGAINTSVWLIGWGQDTVYYIYPRGSGTGIQHQDRGQQSIQQQDDTLAAQAGGQPSLRMEAFVDLFELDVGLALKDWRFAVRIANLEVGDFALLTGDQDPAAFANLLHKMAMATARIPSWGMIRPAFYMNRTIFSGLQRLALEKSSAVLRINEALGQFGVNSDGMLSFLNVPIRLCDALVNTETQLT